MQPIMNLTTPLLVRFLSSSSPKRRSSDINWSELQTAWPWRGSNQATVSRGKDALNSLDLFVFFMENPPPKKKTIKIQSKCFCAHKCSKYVDVLTKFSNLCIDFGLRHSLDTVRHHNLADKKTFFYPTLKFIWSKLGSQSCTPGQKNMNFQGHLWSQAGNSYFCPRISSVSEILKPCLPSVSGSA